MNTQTHIIVGVVTLLFLILFSFATAWEEVKKEKTQHYQLPLICGLAACSLYWVQVILNFFEGRWGA